MQAKQTVRELLDRLPDDCSLDEVLYHLYVVNSIDKGIADADNGNVVTHAEAAKSLRQRWLQNASE